MRRTTTTRRRKRTKRRKTRRTDRPVRRHGSDAVLETRDV